MRRRTTSPNLARSDAGIARLLTLALVLVLLVGGVWAFRHSLPGVRRLAAFAEKASTVRVRDLRACRCASDRDVRFAREDGLEIAGGIYQPEGPPTRDAVLLLHGNTPRGHRLAFYRILARRLAERGHLVLAIDFAGSGSSGDPFARGGVEALDPALDVRAALDFLQALEPTPRDVTVIGHSGGSVGALRAGLDDRRVARLVLIGPPRRTTERLQDPDDRGYFWRRHQAARLETAGAPFPEWYTEETWLELGLASDPVVHLPELAASGHKPILFLDGELEDGLDRAYLTDYVARVAEPRSYETIPNANHYSNSRDFVGLAFYERTAVARTVDAIDRWIRRWRGEGAAG